MNRVVFKLIVIASLVVLGPSVMMRPSSKGESEPVARHSQSYEHSAKGLENEYEPLLKAVAKGDPSSFNESYTVFAIPDPGTWFGSYFKKENVEQLGWDYEPELESGKKSLIMMLKLASRGQQMRFRVHCKPPDHDPTNGMSPRSDSMLPDKQVAVEQFQVEMAADEKHRFSFLGNYVYVDGACRYVGKGAYPFWSMPDATREKH